MPSSRLLSRWIARVAVWGTAAVLAGILGVTLYKIVLRLRFQYDLLYWPDDYFMTLVMKIGAGEPIYSRSEEHTSEL